MSVIKHPLFFVGSRGEKNLFTLFDSGANLSCIHPDYTSIANLETLGRTRRISTALKGQFVDITCVVRLDFYINDVLVSDEFLVVPGLSEQAIIGAATMHKWRIKIDFEYDTVFVDPRVAKMQLI